MKYIEAIGACIALWFVSEIIGYGYPDFKTSATYMAGWWGAAYALSCHNEASVAPTVWEYLVDGKYYTETDLLAQGWTLQQLEGIRVKRAQQ